VLVSPRVRLPPSLIVTTVWLAPAALATIGTIAQRRLHGEAPASVRDLLWAGGDWFIYAFLTPPIFWIAGRWPIVRPHLARRALLHLGISLLFCIAWAVGGKLLQVALGLLITPDELRGALASAGDQFWWMIGRDIASWLFTTFPFGVIVYFCVAGVAHAIRYFVEAREREVQMARLSAQLSDARLAALHAQLNPHFLFNSLNTIAVLVRDGHRAAATRVIEQLSEVLRSTLGRSQGTEVTLENELYLVRQYVAVEQARFSDRLRPEFDVPDTLLSAAVPRFALQHLVENAIRHGIARRSDAGRLSVSAQRDGDVLELAVVDDGAGVVAAADQQAGHGLENTRERLRTLYGDRGSLILAPALPHGTVARLRLPYREMDPER
jgi:hypothetical protein